MTAAAHEADHIFAARDLVLVGSIRRAKLGAEAGHGQRQSGYRHQARNLKIFEIPQEVSCHLGRSNYQRVEFVDEMASVQIKNNFRIQLSFARSIVLQMVPSRNRTPIQMLYSNMIGSQKRGATVKP